MPVPLFNTSGSLLFSNMGGLLSKCPRNVIEIEEIEDPDPPDIPEPECRAKMKLWATLHIEFTGEDPGPHSGQGKACKDPDSCSGYFLAVQEIWRDPCSGNIAIPCGFDLQHQSEHDADLCKYASAGLYAEEHEEAVLEDGEYVIHKYYTIATSGAALAFNVQAYHNLDDLCKDKPHPECYDSSKLKVGFKACLSFTGDVYDSILDRMGLSRAGVHPILFAMSGGCKDQTSLCSEKDFEDNTCGCGCCADAAAAGQTPEEYGCHGYVYEDETVYGSESQDTRTWPSCDALASGKRFVFHVDPVKGLTVTPVGVNATVIYEAKCSSM